MAAGDLDLGTVSMSAAVNMGDFDAAVLRIKATAADLKKSGDLTISVNTADGQAQVAALIAAETRLKEMQGQLAIASTALRQAQTEVAVSTGALRQEQIASTAAMTANRTEAGENAGRLAQLREAQASLRLEMVQARAAAEAEAAAMRLQRQEILNSAAAAKAASAAHADLAKSLSQAGGSAVSGGLNIAGKAVSALKTLLEDAAKSAGILALSLTGVAAASAKLAVDYQTQLTQVQNNTTMTTADVAVMDKTIKAMAASSPASLNELSNGFMHAFNMTGNAADATKILEAAWRSAVSTGASVAETTNVLATVMHQFAIPIADVAKTMDLLHVAAAQGNLTLEQFVGAAGPAYAQASALGVSLVEANAAMTAFSRSGFDAQESATAFANVLIRIEKPGTAAKAALVELSKASGVDLVDDFSAAGLAAKGLSGVMADVEKATGGDTAKILDLIPQLRGARGALVLAGEGADDYRAALNAQADVLSGKVTPTQDAFERSSATVAFQLGTLKNIVHLLAIEIGTVLFPVIQTIIAGMIQFGDTIARVFNIPGISQLKTGMDQFNAAQAAGEEQAKSLALAIGGAGTTGSTALLDAANAAKQLKTDTGEATTQIDQLTAKINALNVSIHDTQQQIQDAKDKFAGLIDPLQRQLDAINRLSPDENLRKVQDLGLQQQEIQIKLSMPDTSGFDSAIEGARQKIDDLGKANTDVIDQRISGIQDKIRALGSVATREIDQHIQDLRDELNSVGDTSDLDRKIKQVQDALKGFDKAPDTTGLTNQMAGLNAQRLMPGADQDAINRQYAGLSNQKAGIIANAAAQKSMLQQQLEALTVQRDAAKEAADTRKKEIEDEIRGQESIKRNIELRNATAREAAEADLRDAQAQRESIIKNHQAQVDNLNDYIKGQERAKKAAEAPYQTALKQVEAARQHIALLDKQDEITRRIAAFPLEQQIAKYKDDLKDTLDPLEKQLELYNRQKTALDEQKAKWEDIRRGITDAANAAKMLDRPPATKAPPGGKAPGASLFPFGVAGEFGGNDPGLASAAKPPAWLDGLVNAFKTAANDISGVVTRVKGDLGDLLKWGEDHQEAIKTFLGDSWDETVRGANMALTVLETVVKTATGVVQVAIDAEQHDWGKAWDDIESLTDTGQHRVGALYDEFGNKLGDSTTTTLTDLKQSHKTYSDNLLGDYRRWWDDYVFQENKGQGVFDTTADRWLKGAFGPGGYWGKAFSDLGTHTNEWFGEGGHIGQIFSGFGTWLATGDTGWVGRTMAALGKGAGQGFSDLGTTVNHWFGDGGEIGQKFEQFGTWLGKFFGEGGAIVKALGGLESFAKKAINTSLLTPLQNGINGVAAFVSGIQDGINWVAGKVGLGKVAGDPWGGYTVPLLAGGTDAWAGGTAIVGERGREIVEVAGDVRVIERPMMLDLPAGARVISNVETERILAGSSGTDIPSSAVHTTRGGDSTVAIGRGGFFDVLGGAAGGVFDGVKHLGGAAAREVRSVISRGAEALFNEAIKALGITAPAMPGMMSGIGGAIFDSVKKDAIEGLKDLFKGEGGLIPADRVSSARGGAGLDTPRGNASALWGYLDSIFRASDEFGVPAELIGAIIMHESGGQVGRVQAGGLGRGLMQVDLGYHNYGPNNAKLTGTGADDAWFQIEKGTEILAQFFHGDWADAIQNYAGPAYRSQASGGVPAGLMFYDELSQFYIPQVLSALSGPPTATGPTAPGVGWPDVYDAAHAQIGSRDWGSGFNTLCEGFSEQMERLAGYSEGRWDSAAAHAYGVTHNAGIGPIGSMMHWGTGYYSPYGHAGISSGDGFIISTTSGGSIAEYDMSNANDLIGWLPPGMAKGGVFSNPTVVTVGDTPPGVDEIVTPEDKMMRIMKEALGASDLSGGGININGGLHIHANTEAGGRQAANGFIRQADSLTIRRRKGLPG